MKSGPAEVTVETQMGNPKTGIWNQKKSNLVIGKSQTSEVRVFFFLEGSGVGFCLLELHIFNFFKYNN